jgi:hypothetical protein
MAAAFFLQHVVQVFEKFYMAALITRYGYPLNILFNSGFGDFRDGSVVAQMDDFGAGVLKNPPDDIDGGVMPVK